MKGRGIKSSIRQRCRREKGRQIESIRQPAVRSVQPCSEYRVGRERENPAQPKPWVAAAGCAVQACGSAPGARENISDPQWPGRRKEKQAYFGMENKRRLISNNMVSLWRLNVDTELAFCSFLTCLLSS